MSKGEYIARALTEMREHLGMPPWSVAEKIVLAARVLHAAGHDSNLAGQISARTEHAAHFLTQRMGLGFDEIKTSDLLRVDEALQVLDGLDMPSPANRFHAWIYRDHPNVQCIIHTHPLHVSALSMLGQRLKIAHMDTCVLFDDIAFLPTWPGVPVSDNEGEIISNTLGDKRAILLAHHGLLVASRSVEEACIVALQAERAARLQLLAAAAGEIREIDPQLGQEAHDWLLEESRVQATFHYHARRILQQHPGCLV